MLACDLFTVDTVLLRRIYVFFVFEIASRRAHVLGITRQQTEQWVTQQARNFVMSLEQRIDAFRFLLRDRDAKFTGSFDAVFADAGIAMLRSPPRAPKANAYAERWVGTVRRECLDRLLIFNDRQLLRVLAEYETHYNTHRPHRSLDQRPPAPGTGPAHDADLSSTVRRTEVLGGLIHEYRPAA